MENPYLFGGPVTGDNFYGEERRRLIKEICNPNNYFTAYAIFGLRRYGKSSLLRELETTIDSSHLRVHWDLAGCDELAIESLCDGLSLLDEQLAAIGLTYKELAASDELFKALQLLIRATGEHGKTLWLLCDECDSLRDFHKAHPGKLTRLRRLLFDVNAPHVRIIMAGSRPMSELLFTKIILTISSHILAMTSIAMWR